MNTHSLTKWMAASLLLVALAWTVPAWTQDAPATAAVETPKVDTPPAAGETTPAKQAAVGLEHAIAGHFEQGLKELTLSAKAFPDNASVAAAVKLLGSFNTYSAKSEQERAAEYKTAVEQVQSALFAMKVQPQLTASGLDKKLRAKIFNSNGGAATMPATASAPASEPAHKSVVGAYNRSSTSEVLSTSTDAEGARKLQTRTVEALAEARAMLAEAVALVKDDGEFGVAFRKAAAELDKQFAAYAKAWKDATLDDAKSIAASVKDVRAVEDDLADALTDLETLVTEKPYLMAMAQARLAVQLLPTAQREKVTSADWYRQLVTDVLKLGATAMEKQDWYEALNIYSNLSELAPDVDEYREKQKAAQRHVRVMRLYGGKPVAATAPDEGEPTWKEMVGNVDVEMVRTAITSLDENYVTAPDYKKLARAGLLAVKVLAQTPQAANALTELAQEEKRTKFLTALDDLLGLVGERKRMDYMDLIQQLNEVVQASEQTVGLRKDVLSVEFMDGCLEELDKFSNMIWPYEVAEFNKSTMGNFSGVGIQIGKEPGEPLKVVSPLEDSPAYRAGIKSGDLILQVGDIKTEGLSVDALVKKITGPDGTKVVLLVKSPGLPPRPIELIRQQIKIKTVKGWQRKGDDWDYFVDPVAKVGYIRLTQFTDGTARELDEKIVELKKDGMKSLILDLRFNPGGLLRSAGAVSDEFLKEGTIVSTRGRQSGSSQIDATVNGPFQEGDLVVLVNQFSASAAEIVSGALKDLHRAVIIGQRSYGKGSVQNVIPVGHRKAILKVTNAYYYLPSGRCLHRKPGDKEWGVDPDVDVLVTPRQMKHWLDIRRKTDLLQDVDAVQLKAEMAEQFDADIQLNTAVLVLKLMQLQKEKPVAPADVAEVK